VVMCFLPLAVWLEDYSSASRPLPQRANLGASVVSDPLGLIPWHDRTRWGLLCASHRWVRNMVPDPEGLHLLHGKRQHDLTEEQLLIQDTARKFSQERLAQTRAMGAGLCLSARPLPGAGDSWGFWA